MRTLCRRTMRATRSRLLRMLTYINKWKGGNIMRNIKLPNKFFRKCLLKIDGRYFGYDSHPQYPETTYRSKEKGYEFESKESALMTAAWHPGYEFEIIPTEER